MGTTERKEREKEQRKASILDAAESVFKKKGLQVATMSDVAEEAELAKGTLYLYFKSKDDLCFGLNARALAMLAESFQKAFESKEKGIGKVRAIGEAYIEFSVNQPLHAEIMLNYGNHELTDDVTENMGQCLENGRKTMEILEGAIGAGMQDGSIRKTIDPMLTSFLLWSFSEGLMQLIKSKAVLLKQHYNVQTKELTNQSFDFIEKALAP